jgi:hypothetical protein
MESDLTASEDEMADLSKAPGLGNQASGSGDASVGSSNLHLIVIYCGS